MILELRDYQQRALEELKRKFKQGKKRIMLVAPPGAGKGSLVVAISHMARQKDNGVTIFMHKQDLVRQQVKRLWDQGGIYAGYYLAGEEMNHLPVMVGSVQTMNRRMEYLMKTKMVICDECHRLPTQQHRNVYDFYKDSYFIGMTATPFRGDKKGFTEFFDDIIQVSTYRELVANKWLVPTRVIAPKISPDLDGVKTKGSGLNREYVDESLLDAFNDDKIYQGLVDKWKEHAFDRKTLVFNVNNTGHSRTTAEYFKKNQIEAEFVDYKTSKRRRKELLKAFERGDFQVFCNIGLFTEGISVDDTSCIVFNVATKIMTKWVQAAARGSRPVLASYNSKEADWARKPDGSFIKEDCLIIDLGRNAERHGFIDLYDIVPFSLDGIPKKFGENRTKQCPECDHTWPVQVRICKNCGHGFEMIGSEEKLAYADDLEWEEVKQIKNLAKKILDMPYNKLAKSGPDMLRIVGAVKGYKYQWAYHMAYKLGYINVHPHDYMGVKKIADFLKESEKEAGTAGMYEAFSNHPMFKKNGSS